jgi:hopanoid biosynthesis associated protein HpnK
MRELIVTGDDFGTSPGANLGIARAHDEGVLTGASLMVTGSAFADAVELAHQRPHLSTGLHLVLCDGLPASDPGRIPGLVEASGEFPRDPARTGFALWFQRRELRQQIECEVHAQCERFLATGLPFDSIDGHHHLHMHPVVFAVVLEAAAKYGVPRIRLMREDGIARQPGDDLGARFAAGAHAALSRFHARALAKRGDILAAERVYGLRRSGRCDEEWWTWLIPRLQARRVEIYCHPDVDQAEGARELAALCSPEVRQAIARADYALARRDIRE